MTLLLPVKRRGWRDDRKAGLALLALGLPFVLLLLFPSLGPACPDTGTCEPLSPVALASRAFVLSSMSWLPVLAVLAFWSKVALWLLAISGVLIAALTALMTSPMSAALAPLDLSDLPVFGHLGVSALIAGVLAGWDLRMAGRANASRTPGPRQ